MEFIEVAVFSKLIRELIEDEAYRLMQNTLVEHPEAGDIIPGAGGARKLRWGQGTRGKSGGIRVIYVLRPDRIYFIVAYTKGRKDNLSRDEIRIIRELAKSIK